MELPIIFALLVMSFNGALLAELKGRRVFLWAMICLFLPVAIILLLCLPSLRRCSSCGEKVKRASKACHRCGLALANTDQRTQRPARNRPFHNS